MKSVHTQLAFRNGFEFLPTLPFFEAVCQVGLVTCNTVCIGKMTRRGHSAFAGNMDNQKRTR